MATPWISDDTLDGYIHPSDMIIEDYDRFTKDEDGNPYNKGVYVSDDTLDGYLHPYGMEVEDYDRFTKDEDGNPYNKGVYVSDDTLDGYLHPYGMAVENWTEFTKDENGYPYNNGVFKFKEYNDGYPYIFKKSKEFSMSSCSNKGFWKFPTLDLPVGANQNEEYEVENDGYPHIDAYDFAYRRFTKNRRGYPFQFGAWKYDANNDHYPWIVGFTLMKGDMVRILRSATWQTVADKLVYTQSRLKDSYWEHNKDFE